MLPCRLSDRRRGALKPLHTYCVPEGLLTDRINQVGCAGDQARVPLSLLLAITTEDPTGTTKQRSLIVSHAAIVIAVGG
jgi:hypothetical protein